MSHPCISCQTRLGLFISYSYMLLGSGLRWSFTYIQISSIAMYRIDVDVWTSAGSFLALFLKKYFVMSFYLILIVLGGAIQVLYFASDLLRNGLVSDHKSFHDFFFFVEFKCVWIKSSVTHVSELSVHWCCDTVGVFCQLSHPKKLVLVQALRWPKIFSVRISRDRAPVRNVWHRIKRRISVWPCMNGQNRIRTEYSVHN